MRLRRRCTIHTKGEGGGPNRQTTILCLSFSHLAIKYVFSFLTSKNQIPYACCENILRHCSKLDLFIIILQSFMVGGAGNWIGEGNKRFGEVSAENDAQGGVYAYNKETHFAHIQLRFLMSFLITFLFPFIKKFQTYIWDFKVFFCKLWCIERKMIKT